MKGKKIFIVMAVVFAVAVSLTAFRAPRLAPESVVLIEISGDIPEAPPAYSPIMAFIEKPLPTMLDKIITFRKAKVDPRVRAVVLKISTCSFGLAKAQELRDAISDYRLSGKPIYASLALESGGDVEYYIASACDKVYMAESSMPDINGMSIRSIFLGGMWEKIYVDVQVDKIREYKSAGDMIGARGMSPELREMVTSIIDSEYRQFVEGIAASRGLEKAAVEKVIDGFYMFPERYVEAGFVDGIKYLDEVLDEASTGARFEPEIVTEKEYAKVEPSKLGLNRGPRVALIYGVGNIVAGDPGGTPFSGNLMSSDRMVKELMDAAEDESIKAVIFRIDSGGGSALASDLIWRATRKIKEKKPFVVSMSDVAGSGGYYIACGSDKIVAQPGTLTGSIGVVTAHISLGGLIEKAGINTVTISRGKFGDIGDITRPMTSEERGKTVKRISKIYEMFTGKVSEGRGISVDGVNEIGRGRVWTGAQALELGLVDETGGIMKAVEIVKEILGVPVDRDVEIVYRKPAMTIWQVLMGRGIELMTKSFLTEDEYELVGALRSGRAYREGEPLCVMPFTELR